MPRNGTVTLVEKPSSNDCLSKAVTRVVDG